MSRRRSLTDDEAAELYDEYCRWLALSPKKLMAKYGIVRSTMTRYVRKLHKRRAA